MGYFAWMLQQYIGNRKLRDVVAALGECGVSISESYLCKMRSGTKHRPTPELLRAISRICGRDPGPLEFAVQCDGNPGPILESVLDAISGGDMERRPRSMSELLSAIRGGDSSDG